MHCEIKDIPKQTQKVGNNVVFFVPFSSAVHCLSRISGGQNPKFKDLFSLYQIDEPLFYRYGIDHKRLRQYTYLVWRFCPYVQPDPLAHCYGFTSEPGAKVVARKSPPSLKFVFIRAQVV